VGENQRHDIGKTGDAAKKENERSSEGKSVGYGQGTLEEGAGRRQERALRRRLCSKEGLSEKGLQLSAVQDTLGPSRYFL